MIETSREGLLLETFATLADTLVAGYDVVDLLQTLVDTCHQLFHDTAAGILLADENGELEVVASTSEASRLVETMQLSAEAGPCVECFTTGQVVSLADIHESPPEWSRFRDRALGLGFVSVYAIPLRLRETTIGALNLLRTVPGELEKHDLIAARAFADVATIGILHERTLRENIVIREQLQNALSSRIIIEQAKGVVAHTHKVSVDDAFALIRTYARSNRMGLAQVAAQVVDRTLTL
ncbi:GAF and ANTAR domain-containing protein [soil metagenome]